MAKFSVLESWLGAVAYSHSGSKNTEVSYRRNMQNFCGFIGKTPEEVVQDYAVMTEKQFKLKYVELIQAWIHHLRQTKKYTPGSIGVMIAPIMSFLKYKNLAQIHIPSAKATVVYHNRPLEKAELVEILKVASIRDKAFFTLCAQSGLRPGTVCCLKIEDVEGIRSENTPIPCLITVKESNTKGAYSSYFSFVGEESVRYLKDYLKTRENTEPSDWLFCKQGHENTPLSRSSVGHAFRKLADHLKAKGLVEFKKGKRSEVRLYNLRKFFRKFASQAGTDFVNFWMGHSLGVDNHYFTTDPELHREVYRKKALPYLRVETATPSETEHTIKRLEREIEEVRQENLELKQRLNGFTLSSDQVAELLRRIEKLEKQAQKQK